MAKAAGGDGVSDAVVGIVEPVEPLFETTANGELPRRHVEAAISGLRDSGLNERAFEQAVNLPPISPRRVHVRAGVPGSVSRLR